MKQLSNESRELYFKLLKCAPGEDQQEEIIEEYSAEVIKEALIRFSRAICCDDEV